jgi:hypothetical protein
MSIHEIQGIIENVIAHVDEHRKCPHEIKFLVDIEL